MTTTMQQYFDLKREYSKKYSQCIILGEIGAFREIYGTDIAEMTEIAQKLNMILTSKNKKIPEISENNPKMIGFPSLSIEKHLPVLTLDYTVILWDQDIIDKTVRKVSKIYSPGTAYLEDTIYGINMTSDNNYLVSLFIELFPDKCNTALGIAIIDIQNGNLKVFEAFSEKTDSKLGLDEIYSFLKTISYSEFIINIKTCRNSIVPDFLLKDNLTAYLEVYCTTHYLINDIEKIKYTVNFQNTFFKTIFKKHDMKMLHSLEYLDMEHKSYATIALIELLEFTDRHDNTLNNDLEKPEIVLKSQNLILESNTIEQINLFSERKKSNLRTCCKTTKFKSVFHVINNTNTTLGKRLLEKTLKSPFNNPDVILNRYSLSDEVWKIGYQKFENLLLGIVDLERLERRIHLKKLAPIELLELNKSYIKISELINLVENCNFPYLKKILLDDNHKTLFIDFINDYTKTFDVEKIQTLNTVEIFNHNIFAKGIQEIDDTEKEINDLINKLETIAKYYANFIEKNSKRFLEVVKIVYQENEGYFFQVTIVKLQQIKKCISKSQLQQLSIRTLKSGCKITSKEIDKLSLDITTKKLKLKSLVKTFYYEKLEEYSLKYNFLFIEINKMVALIDVTTSNVKTSSLYRYSRPKLEISDKPFFNAVGSRHVLIERFDNNLHYVKNDISSNFKQNGKIINGENMAGKSSLLKSVVLIIIMAQSGLFVPCDNFSYSPYDSILSQVDGGGDDIFTSKSSYMCEILQLNNILKRSNDRSLIICDEILSTTEHIGSIAIFATTVQFLTNKNIQFLFSTHNHEIADLDMIKNLKGVDICHLETSIVNDKIIFNRKLCSGVGSRDYAIKMAKSLGSPHEFIVSCLQIKKELTNKKKEILKTKTSKYNRNKLVDRCEICNYSPVKKTDGHLQVHHIDFQCTADSNGIIDTFHKNTKANLVTLCASCHETLHKQDGQLIINGYHQTSDGVELDFMDNRNSH